MAGNVARSLAEALRVLEETSLPALIRPAFTLGGVSGAIAHDREEFERIVASGLDASPIAEVLIEAAREAVRRDAGP
jgi:carbamoyl-phosphate synthase large subunit